MGARRVTLLITLLSIFLVPANAVYHTNVVSFGARANSKTDSTQAFLKAWSSACASRQPVEVSVPKGRYYLKQVIFRGPCRNNATSFSINGTLLAPSYRVVNTPNWIYFDNVNGVSITGGALDGRGVGYWACRKAGRKHCPSGARNLVFNSAANIIIKGLTSVNSQVTHIEINNCNNVLIQGLRILAPDDSPNTDGIHVQLSEGVTIRETSIKTGDDCVSIGKGTTNLLIEGSNCGPGHGISIGSLGRETVEEGVENVTVRDVVFSGSDSGLRIETWPRRSSGFVKGILYQNIIMKNVKSPIIIEQQNCPAEQGEGCGGQEESGVKISGVTYQNIEGSSTSQMAVKFHCSSSNPCTGIRLQTVQLTYGNKEAKASCLNADGVSSGSVLPASCL